MPAAESSAASATFLLWLNQQVLLVLDDRPFATSLTPQWSAAWSGDTPVGALHAQLLGFANAGEAATLRVQHPASAELSRFTPIIPPKHTRGFLCFLLRALDWDLPRAEIMVLAETLRLVRDAWQPVRASPLFGVLPIACVDLVARANSRTLYFRGWWRSCHGRIVRLTAVSPEGRREELLPRLCEFARGDIPPAYEGDVFTGFAASVQLANATWLNSGWRVELETIDGFAADIPAPPVVGDADAVIAAVIPDLGLAQLPAGEAIAEHVHAAISRVQEQRSAEVMVEEVLQLGAAVERPALSVIVPLYGRIDLVEHQLAQFAVDPAWRWCDLIYVLDSPADWGRLVWRTEALVRLYGISLRLVRLNQNGGYAAASNLGATLARAELFLFLNSDVLPCGPAWIEPMIACYRRKQGGALGPKLLFEDGSIQHAGESFSPSGDGSTWDVLPYFKGLHRDLPEANQPRAVPMVTGACLMVSRQHFWDAGGFDRSYVQGDFEDVDLCLRLTQMGLANHYDPTIELYHLEGVSYPVPARQRQFAYNRWLLARKWGPVIQQTVSQSEEPRRLQLNIPA